jgi:PAP2 superfamily C-terminal
MTVKFSRTTTVKESLLVPGLVCLTGIYCSAFAQAAIEVYYKNGRVWKNDGILPDLGFYMFDLTRIKYWISPNVVDYLVLIEVLLSVGTTSFFGRNRLAIFKRLLLSLGLMYFLRSLATVLTILPNPDFTCESEIPQKYPFWIDVFRIMLRQRITCGDVMFSGHTSLVVLCDLLLWGALSKSNKKSSPRIVCCWMNRCFTIFACLVFIASKFHYTIDVVIGAAVSIFAWNFFRPSNKLYSIRKTSLIPKMDEKLLQQPPTDLDD